jgi:hypothetical protein
MVTAAEMLTLMAHSEKDCLAIVVSNHKFKLKLSMNL